MKKYLLSIATLFLCIAISCNKPSNTPSTTALVLFSNGCIPSSAPFSVDARVNNNTVVGATNIALLKNSGYVHTATGVNEGISFFVIGLSTLISGNATLSTSSNYSVFAGGTVIAPCMLIQYDDLATPTSGNAKVRFVNLCADTLNENCYIGSTELDSNVGYKTITPFTEIAATTANVLMQDPLHPTSIPPNSMNGQGFASGKIYTIVLTGVVTGSGTSALTYTLINNN